MVASVEVFAPEVPGVREVLRADFDHAYPRHTHDAWSVLLIDAGAVSYDLDRGAHHAVPRQVTVLPPDVPHDGRSAVAGQGFRKRVLYLERDWLPAVAVGHSVDRPAFGDAAMLQALPSAHAALELPGEELAAEVHTHRLRDLLRGALAEQVATAADVPLARRLRRLLDDEIQHPPTLAEAGRRLGASAGHLSRSFTRAHGIAPHQHLTSRRVDLARSGLLAGRSPAEVADEVGFVDQSHLSRHIRRVLGVTPGVFTSALR